MNLPLTSNEKEKVADIIRILFSESNIDRKKDNINQQTIVALEVTLIAIDKCNHDMIILITQLIGGSALISKGWLRKILTQFHRAVTNEKIMLNGYACSFSRAYNHKSAILMPIEYGH